MSELLIRIVSQEGLDNDGRLQSHQWAAIPPELAGVYMSGGLKKVRRLAEGYFSYRFSEPAAKKVRARWHSGEPHLDLLYYHVPGLHGRGLARLGRLRSTGTRDVYRGYHEVRGGQMVSPAARVERRSWPDDMPWVAPSAGEFIDSELEKSSYLGIFELRVERTPTGCNLHTVLIDFPPVTSGFNANLWQKPWQPMRSTANIEFLRRELTSAAKSLDHTVRFEVEERAGTPERLQFRFDSKQPSSLA
jgi:hypothetical protein